MADLKKSIEESGPQSPKSLYEGFKYMINGPYPSSQDPQGSTIGKPESYGKEIHGQ